MESVFALVDCNNFYVSCERVFNPKLCGRPVVVLSNNDGCVISRSEEAKAVGVKMGAPLFQIQKLIDTHRVEVYSSNYALYGDMCTRVMDTLRETSPEVEVYSIDEAFIGLSGVTTEQLYAVGRETSERVRKWTGIPVSIGIATTKTLAKVAAHIAKKSSRAEGVVNLVELPYLDAALARVPVENVWGVGRNYARRLKERGICTARELRSAHDGWVRKEMGVAGLRILYELRGTSCLPLEWCPPPKKGITVSRSFGRPVESLEEIREAVAAYVSRAGEKLRRQQLAATTLIVFLATSRFIPESHHAASVVVNLPVPTDITPELIRYAHEGVGHVFRAGHKFKKAGMMLIGLVPVSPIQAGLFDEMNRARARRLMQTVDAVNARMGHDTLRYAGAGLEQNWRARAERRSPGYTTCWNELLTLSPL